MSKKPSDLDSIIPPEIKNDAFYNAIIRLSSTEKIKTILEIGSSSGTGSTSAFIEGISKNQNNPTLFCMEVSKPRFESLKNFASSYPFVKCYNCSSIGLDKFPSEQEVSDFYHSTPTPLNDCPLERILGWLQQDIDYIRENASPENGIELIKRENNVTHFDMVLIDGSEFTGKAELNEVYGARFILLDDINGFKNRFNYDRLKADSSYQLIEENWQIRLGYAIFKKKAVALPINFFTIVLNGKPFIDYHIKVFESLSVPWHWHIVEGVANLVHDTGWGVPNGATVPSEFHKDGLSVDGTSEYLDELEAAFPENISVYRKPKGQFWNGKLEMVNAPIQNIHEQSLLWQVDADEFWNKQQIEKMHLLFSEDETRTAAWFWCNYFVGPHLTISSRNCYAMNPQSEWLRVWRFKPKMFWTSHEPPALAIAGSEGRHDDVGRLYPFTHTDTERHGLVFDHFAYVTEEQIRFKESYYGYAGATESWKRLQKATQFPLKLRDYFAWVTDETTVVSNRPASNPTVIKETEKDSSNRAALQPKETADIVIDGVFFQMAQTGIARLWSSILKCWSKTDFAKRIIILDRNGTAPKFQNIRYQNIPAYHIGNFDNDSAMLEDACRNTNAKLFLSTYYTKPQKTKTLQMVYDMIPEQLKYDLVHDARWHEKQLAFQHASKFVCISEYTKQDLLKFHPRLNADEVEVIHPAYDPAVFNTASVKEILDFHTKYQITKPYYVLVGPAKGYKNVEMFAQAMSMLPTQHGFEAIFVGGWISPEDIQSLKVGCEIKHLKLDDVELRVAYSGAIAMVYPSKYEGFGLPVLEAMACNCPVVTTSFTSIPEAAGSSVLYANDAVSMASQLCEVQKPEIRARLVKQGNQNLTRFSWEQNASRFASVIEAIISKQERQITPGRDLASQAIAALI